jgi:hypothetical protein
MAETPEDKWPAVMVAYDFVMPSYSLLVSRFEAADTRLTILLTFAATVTLGAPVLAKAMQPNIEFMSPRFLSAVASAMLSVGLGIAARVRGRLTLPNPKKVYNENLHESEWAFRKNALYFAGQHFDLNADAIRRKGNWAIAAALLIILEIILFLPWIALAP